MLESKFDIYDPDSEPAAPARILHLRITQAFFRQMKMLVNATYKCTNCMYVCMYVCRYELCMYELHVCTYYMYEVYVLTTYTVYASTECKYVCMYAYEGDRT